MSGDPDEDDPKPTVIDVGVTGEIRVDGIGVAIEDLAGALKDAVDRARAKAPDIGDPD
jgi:hypothetical protein